MQCLILSGGLSVIQAFRKGSHSGLNIKTGHFSCKEQLSLDTYRGKYL